uniref:Lipid scramblase CLPTM1L n=1 Tax=Fundulus heteroclitus TaxID=8078 RepID=A0A3Q2QG50_FUNHE
MFLKTSFTTLIVGVFVVYVLHTCWVMYGIVYTKPCDSPKGGNCITPFLAGNPKLQVSRSLYGGHTLIHLEENFNVNSKFERIVNVSLPKKTRNNGTLYALIFVHQAGLSPWQDPRQVHLVAQLTTYMVPKPPEISLISGEEQTQVHHFLFFFFSLLLLLLWNCLSTSTELPLTVSYDSISLGRLRFWIHMQDAVYSLQQFGFTEKDADEIKGIFVDTNLYFLALTFFVAAFHLLFDFLAFKNDISFWKQKKSMVGMSSKAVLWRCFSTIVIFLYLFDEQTSLLVLIPAGIGSIIEVRTHLCTQTLMDCRLDENKMFGKLDESERRTEEYDTLAMKYLSYLLYPLCIGGALYALIFLRYKSWYSWLINSLVNGVYAFGFLFMLPQLFVNYKLKSVAHLPWKAFMYKAFNTFIDDVFAFIITMPTSHRLACFRDDVVFLIYLYQRWLYPVDRTRVNEYGVSYDEKPKGKGKPHKD